MQADAKGKVVVDEHLRCAASPTATPGRVFAAGDVMRLPGCKDLKVGHTAELNADVVAANIRAAAKGEAAPPHLEEYAAYLPSPHGVSPPHRLLIQRHHLLSQRQHLPSKTSTTLTLTTLTLTTLTTAATALTGTRTAQ